jgi:hypothetical protein
MKKSSNLERALLIAGDIITLAIVTVIGFASHGTADTAGSRMLTTFIPLVIAWFLFAPLLHIFDKGIYLDVKQLWRPLWAMILASPMAAWVRGLLLNSPILPLFVIILGGVSAVAILLWRGIFWFVATRLKRADG